MYTPKHFKNKNRAELIEFMREFNFAAIINKTKNKYWATHIPFLVDEVDGEIVLRAHMAKANPQWVNFNSDEQVLVIFSQPHAYISPGLYETTESVPTWNYIAIHAYGIPEILPETVEKIRILEDSFAEFEPNYKKQWDELSDDYKNELLKGITAFKIKVTDIEGKYKLSQNRSEKERINIIDHLKGSKNKSVSDISLYMEKTKLPYK